MKNYINTLDPFFDQLFGFKTVNTKLMPTNIKETKECYILEIELPDFTKNDIKISLKDGNLTVSASKEEKETEVKYLLKERTATKYARSYYVGDDVKDSDINAKLENGILTLTIFKREPEKKTESFIEIN